MRREVKVNYGKLVDPNKRYPVTSTFSQDGTEHHKLSFVKGSDLTENQIKEILNLPKTKIKGTWGGKRDRKTKAEATKVMRIPISKVDSVKELLKIK